MLCGPAYWDFWHTNIIERIFNRMHKTHYWFNTIVISGETLQRTSVSDIYRMQM